MKETKAQSEINFLENFLAIFYQPYMLRNLTPDPKVLLFFICRTTESIPGKYFIIQSLYVVSQLVISLISTDWLRYNVSSNDCVRLGWSPWYLLLVPCINNWIPSTFTQDWTRAGHTYNWYRGLDVTHKWDFNAICSENSGIIRIIDGTKGQHE